MNTFALPDHLEGKDIKNCRTLLGLTQAQFAELSGVTKKTIERWEGSKAPITGPIVTLVKLLTENAQYAERLRIPPRRSMLRLWYMCGKEPCTLIDVDPVKRRVEIKNYTSFPQHRAFGIVTEPTYEEYEEFLESRCFPRSRDKMKIHLEALGLPFYDPYMIVEKTEGRMAEDDYWIRIER